MEIKFGTDGWRGIISGDFNISNIEKFSMGYLKFLRETGKKSVAIGYDTRFLSKEYAEFIGNLLVENRIDVFVSKEFIPTPVLSNFVVDNSLDGGLMITASHNPYYYNGIKVKGDFGGSILEDAVKEIEEYANFAKCSDKIQFPVKNYNKKLKFANMKTPYFEKITEKLQLLGDRSKIVIETYHGAGQGLLKKLLEQYGYEVIELHGNVNPVFPNGQPEPKIDRLKEIVQLIGEKGAMLGLALDGDADRVGGIGEDGEVIDSQRFFALLLLYLIKSGKRGRVIKSFTSSSMIDILAEKFDLPIITTPVGFKFLSKEMLQGDYIMAGEESGGYALGDYVIERDGIVSGLTLIKFMENENKTPSELLKMLFSITGQFVYKRVDMYFDEKKRIKIVEQIKKYGLKKTGIKIVKTETLDGYKFYFNDYHWIMLRFSGTEPLLRIYCEADSQKIDDVIERTVNWIKSI